MNLELPESIKELVAKLIDNKNSVILFVCLALIVYAGFNAATNLFPERNEEHFKAKEKEAVFTRFDEEGITAIENLIKVGEGIDSNFSNNRENPFE